MWPHRHIVARGDVVGPEHQIGVGGSGLIEQQIDQGRPDHHGDGGRKGNVATKVTSLVTAGTAYPRMADTIRASPPR